MGISHWIPCFCKVRGPTNTMKMGIDRRWIPCEYLTYMHTHWTRIRQPKHFSRMCIPICYETYPRERGDIVYLFQFDNAQKFSRMCMCIEFLIVTQVPKQNNAHAFSCWDSIIHLQWVVFCFVSSGSTQGTYFPSLLPRSGLEGANS